MRPTGWLLLAICVWGVIGLLASIWSQLEPVWAAAGALIALLALSDALALLTTRPLELERRFPGRFALGVGDEVEITLRNRGRRRLAVDLFDGLPDEAEAEGIPWRGEVGARGFTSLYYTVRLMRRGQLSFGPTHLLLGSPAGLWRRRQIAGDAEVVKVYPNYEPVIRFALLSMENQENQMGIIHKNRAGLSREFHQLRDYHEGDVLSQIDWKASSKRMQLISREYQEQRDQNIILAVDCGERMRTLDGGVAQFDHCLNAMLLLSFIALRQGDKVGALGFGGTPRWFPPTRGAHSMTALLNHLYDYQTEAFPSDFSDAAEQLLVRQKRRALVVVLTNIRGEDAGDLLPALRALRRRHLVLLANLREGEIDGVVGSATETLGGALTYCSAQMYLEERAKLFETLGGHGVLAIDSSAQRLPIDLTNEYLRIKAAGKL